MLAYERQYFGDLTLKNATIRKRFKHGWAKGIPTISLQEWRIEPVKIIRYDQYLFAQSDFMEKSIIFHKKATYAVSKERLTEVLLHEMIHAYEALLRINFNNIPEGENVVQYLMGYLTLKIYDSLGAKFKTIFEFISDSRFWVDGHSILFVLKSFDLDIRLKRPLGTILGYERDDYLDIREDTNLESLLSQLREEVWK